MSFVHSKHDFRMFIRIFNVFYHPRTELEVQRGFISIF